MDIVIPKGANRMVGKTQGYQGLPVRDDLVDCPVNGPGTPQMTTAWRPTPEELKALNSGAVVLLRILGSIPPPQLIEVSEPAPRLDTEIMEAQGS